MPAVRLGDSHEARPEPGELLLPQVPAQEERQEEAEGEASLAILQNHLERISGREHQRFTGCIVLDLDRRRFFRRHSLRSIAPLHLLDDIPLPGTLAGKVISSLTLCFSTWKMILGKPETASKNFRKSPGNSIRPSPITAFEPPTDEIKQQSLPGLACS